MNSYHCQCHSLVSVVLVISQFLRNLQNSGMLSETTTSPCTCHPKSQKLFLTQVVFPRNPKP